MSYALYLLQNDEEVRDKGSYNNRDDCLEKVGGKSLSLAPARKRSSATLSPKGDTPLKSPVSTSSEFIYIANEAHYDQVIERIKTVKKTLWMRLRVSANVNNFLSCKRA